MSADNSHQLVIREAIRKIALGRSMERVNMAPGGMSGVGTARMIHGYVAKVHDDPADSERSMAALSMWANIPMKRLRLNL